MIDLSNVTSPAATQVPAGAPGSSGGPTGAGLPTSEQFLRLLVTQLQHQDPLNPVQDRDFTAQLAQFSSLDQLTQVNKNLLGLGGIQQGLVNAQALNLLGKNVLVSGQDQKVRISGGQPDPILVQTPSTATNIKIQVKDAAGKTVRTIDAPLGAGRRAVAWDGLDDAGKPLADGEYTLDVQAKDLQGAAVDASLFIELTIDGVSFTDGGVRLAAGGREVSFADILEIKATA